MVTVTPSTADFGNLKVRPSIDPDADLKPEMEHASTDETMNFLTDCGDLSDLLFPPTA